jgi:hypothetical protein
MPLYKNQSLIIMAIYLYSLTGNHILKYITIVSTKAIKNYSLAYGLYLLINRYFNSSRLKLRVNRQTNTKYYIKT